MNSLRSRTTLAALALLLSLAPIAAAGNERIHPALFDAMAEAGDGGLIEAYVVMSDQLSLTGLEARLPGLSPRARRAEVAQILQDHAAQSQVTVRDVLAMGAELGAVENVRVLWLGNAVGFSATAEIIELLGEIDGVDRIRPIVVHEESAYTDVSAPTPTPAFVAPGPALGGTAVAYPYEDDFESGSLGAEWTVATTGTGYASVSGNENPNGSFQLLMASTIDNSEGTASVTLAVDLTGQSNVGIRFEWKEFGDEDDPEDGVFVSEDGVNYFLALPLTGGSTTYTTKAIQLDDVVASLGLAYTSDFHIRWSWSDNYDIPTDGFGIDDIEIADGVGVPPPSSPEPNIVQLQAPQLWDIGYDGGGVLIANIDSGATWTHTDLINRTWNNPGEIPGNFIDDDLNGHVDDIVGWDFASNGPDPSSFSTHGTNTAGLMVGDGAAGSITGMAPGGTMVVCEINGEFNYWEAQQYAIDVGVDVISSSHSFKWPFSPKPDYSMHRQICEMELAAGIIHANSIGNQGLSLSSYPVPFNVAAPGNSPTPWNHPEQVTGGVSSVLGCSGIHVSDDSLYTSSGVGPAAWEDVTLYDPGYPHLQDPAYFDYPYGGFAGGQPGLMKPDVCTYTDSVQSTTNSGGYAPFGGTSAATPQLGGGMMLLRDVQPEAFPRHIDAAIQLTAFDLGPAGKDTRYGAGKLQVFDAARRLVTLGRAADRSPAIGTTLDVDLFGEDDANVFVFFSGSITDGASNWNLADPVYLVGAVPLDGQGEGGFSGAIPTLPTLVDVAVHFQFGATVIDIATWGSGPLLSVPETVVFTN